MRSSITIAFLAAVPSIYAQSSTSSAQPSVQTIQVGNGGYQYSPNVSNLAVGSTIVFEFMSTNHSVVKAAFGVPCQPYDYINRGQPSFYSGVFNGQDVFSDDVSIYPRRQPTFTDDPSLRNGTSQSTILSPSSIIALHRAHVSITI